VVREARGALREPAGWGAPALRRIIKECLAHADLNDTMLYTRVSSPQMADAFGRLPTDWTQLPRGPDLGPGF
jgi:hypothetical protein